MHKIFLSKTYPVCIKALSDLFRKDSLFRLTGADEIKYDFTKNGKFHLNFKERGNIYGRFIIISKTKILLEWNVTGFKRPPEEKTIVELSLLQKTAGCILTLEHSNIIHEISAKAKQNAWTEILDKLDKELPVAPF